MGAEGFMNPLAFLNACGILAPGTGQARRVSTLADVLGSIEFAGQAAHTRKFALTAIVGGRRGPAAMHMIELELGLLFSLIDFWGVELERRSCNGEGCAFDHR
jgi:hypothetical protein